MDSIFWNLGESFVSVNTILPVFASTLTDQPILIGLVSALINAGWFIPQFLMASYVKKLPRKLPFTKAMGIVERMPFFALPLTAFLLPWFSKDFAIWFFMLVVGWRGFASGMVALPWQEVIALIFPSSVRSRFFGTSRTLGRIMAVVGSAVAGIILATLPYPNNYGLIFSIGAIFIGISYIFFLGTVEPEKHNIKVTNSEPKSAVFSEFKIILQKDKNFRRYLGSRIFFQLGSMASGFLAVYGIQNYSLADQQAAVFSALLFLSSVLGFTGLGVFGDRLGPRKTLLISDMIQILALILAIISPNIWLYYLVFLLFGLSQSGNIIGELVLGMELGTETDRPIYLGLARSIPGIFILLAPILGGSFAGWLGYKSLFIIAVGFVIIGFLVLLLVEERKNI